MPGTKVSKRVLEASARKKGLRWARKTREKSRPRRQREKGHQRTGSPMSPLILATTPPQWRWIGAHRGNVPCVLMNIFAKLRKQLEGRAYRSAVAQLNRLETLLNHSTASLENPT